MSQEIKVNVPSFDRACKRINQAVNLAIQFGGIDGAHHKVWVIDQMVRVLAGNYYKTLVKEACAGEDGPDTYEWDIGIAP